MPKIEGGYYIKARQIRESFIAHASPCVREIWDYLLREANHTDEKYNGFTVKRGQLFKNYKEIRDDLSWHVGYRKEGYSESQTKRAMSVLKKERMIEPVKKPRGVLITVCNYDFYQNPKNYERTNERTNSEPTNEPSTNQQRLSINKKTKNLRRKENKSLPQKNDFAGEIAVEFYLTKRKRKLSGKRLLSFNRFWECFNYKRDKASAADAWLDIPCLTDALVEKICTSATAEADQRDKITADGRTPIYAQGWITAKRWEDEVRTVNQYETIADYKKRKGIA